MIKETKKPITDPTAYGLLAQGTHIVEYYWKVEPRLFASLQVTDIIYPTLLFITFSLPVFFDIKNLQWVEGTVLCIELATWISALPANTPK